MRENIELQRAIRTGRILTGLIVAAVIALAAIGPYTEYLWYAQDARYPQVFTRSYTARGFLFSVVFIPTWLLFFFSLRRALSLTLVYLTRPNTAPLELVSQFLGWIQDKGRDAVRWLSPILAFFLAINFANEWSTWLLATNAQTFGQTDPTYGLDLGFFVFILPWYRALANYAFVAMFLVTALTLGVYIGIQSLAALARIELGYPHVKRHILLLVAGTLLAIAAQVWLKTYEIGLVDSTMFTGAGYAGSIKIAAERGFALLLLVAAVVSLLNMKFGRPYSLAIGAGIALGAYFLIAVMAIPLGIQRFWVGTKFADVEAPYAVKAIAMTRFAYGLDRIETRDFNIREEPSPEQIQQSQATLDNMRLWDPDVMRLSFESKQALRNYYSFDDVDIDRYMIDGKQTMVMLSPREMNPDGLEQRSQLWNLRRLRYTHGYGAVVAKVNATEPDGRPVFLLKDIPTVASGPFKLDVPQLYYGDRRSSMGVPLDQYVLVGTQAPEIDYQIGTDVQTNTWKGDGGIRLNGFFRRLAYAIALGDINLVVAPNFTSNTRLLLHRNVIERCSRIFPFLKFDSDPYLVVIEGRMVWMLDGYTITDTVPYSAMTRAPGGKLNYIRNPVKATVDAYTGEVRAYAVEPNEPLLKAYARIYPGLIRPLSDLQEGLVAHFRYPEDMLSLQSQQLGNYHVTDPGVFLSNGDVWQIANQRGATGVKEPMRPYYVQMRLPDEPKAGFLQILPFTPYQRGVLSGWLAAHCDPGDYGRLTMYRFSSGSPPPGPELMETTFTSDPDISYLNRTYNNEQSEIILGNLLVVPIGDSVMYVEPLFLRTRAQSLQNSPPLFRIVLAIKDRIVVRPTYEEALKALFSGSGATVSTTGSKPTTPAEPERPQTPAEQATARRALELLREADQAMRAGDWARYGEVQKQLRTVLEQVVQQQEQ